MMTKKQLTFAIGFWLWLLINLPPGTALEKFGNFSKEGGFQLKMESTHRPIQGFCMGDDYLYAVSHDGYLYKMSTTGTILWIKNLGIGSGFDGAICFDRDTLWVIRNANFGQIHAVDTAGVLSGKTLNYNALGSPYIGGSSGGMIKDGATFWLIQDWFPMLFQIDRNGQLLKHYAMSWLDFWSPTLGIWGNRILKITDSHTPSKIFNNIGVMAFDKNTGAVTDVWDIPKDFSGSTYLGISKNQNNLWAAQYDAVDQLFTVHRLAFPEPSPPPDLPRTEWGNFDIIDWCFCPITPAMIEGLYGLGYDSRAKKFFFGNGIYDFVSAQETSGRYLTVIDYLQLSRKYDIAVYNDTLWVVHFWAGLSSASVSQITIENKKEIVHSQWATGLEQADGLATDGTYIWVSGRDTVRTTGDRNNQIIKFDRKGNPLAHFKYPDDNDHNYEDLTWHQGGLWATTRSYPFGDIVKIQKLDFNTGKVLETYTTGWLSPGQNVCANLASDGNSLLTIATTASGTFDYFEKEHIRILRLQPNQSAFNYNFSQQGWYLISLPVATSDKKLSTLFPTSISAYGWVNDNYVPVTSLEPQKGYWIAMPSPGASTIQGKIVRSYTRHYLQGWHLIGSTMNSVNFTHPNDQPDGSVLTPAYRFDIKLNQYIPADIIEPGAGYWIAVMQECDLTIGEEITASITKEIAAADRNSFFQQFGVQPPRPPRPDRQSGALKPVPTKFSLAPNYPNPFNPETTIAWQMPVAQKVTLAIYDVQGRLVNMLVNAQKETGYHTAHWNGQNHHGQVVPSGIYLYRLQTENFTASGKAMLLK